MKNDDLLPCKECLCKPSYDGNTYHCSACLFIKHSSIKMLDRDAMARNGFSEYAKMRARQAWNARNEKHNPFRKEEENAR